MNTTTRTNRYRRYEIDMIDLADWRIYWGDAYLASLPSLALAKHWIDGREATKADIMALPMVSNGTHAV